MDQMSLYFQATLTRVWSPVGQTPVIRISPQRDQVHFYGALEARLGREFAVTAPEETTEVTADFVNEVLRDFIRLLFEEAAKRPIGLQSPAYFSEVRNSTKPFRGKPTNNI